MSAKPPERLSFVRPSGDPVSLVDDGSCPVLTLYETGTAATVPQYGGWWNVRSPRVPFARIEGPEGPRYVPLDRVEAPDTYRLPKEVRDLGNTAGLLRLYTPDDGTYVPLDPPLYVQPGSVTDTEYHDLLQRIGQIAVAVEGAFMAPVGATADVGDGEGTPDPRLRPVLVYLGLFETVERQWPLIEASPSQTLRHYVRTVESRRGARQPSVARALTRRPGRRTVQALIPVESAQTTENALVAYVLETVLVGRAPDVLSYLQDLAAAERRWDVPDAFEPARGTGSAKAEDFVARLTSQTERARQWAADRRRGPLLRDTPATPPRTLTARMTRSPEYGPVYHAFQAYERAQVPSLRAEPYGVVKALRERAVRKEL